jgi:SAM-dependent methyltransferase
MTDTRFEKFYRKRENNHRYPTEFVIRILNGGRYPNLSLFKPILPGDKILDLGFGDGRNLGLLYDLGLDVYGIEVTQGIVDEVQRYYGDKDTKPKLKIGRNSNIPFPDEYFDHILACSSCYYVDNNESFSDNLREISRVLKPGGTLIANFPTNGNFIIEAGDILPDEYVLIKDDPYILRNGQLMKFFSTHQSIEDYFSVLMENFSFAELNDDFFGIQINTILVTCSKKLSDSDNNTN